MKPSHLKHSSAPKLNTGPRLDIDINIEESERLIQIAKELIVELNIHRTRQRTGMTQFEGEAELVPKALHFYMSIPNMLKKIPKTNLGILNPAHNTLKEMYNGFLQKGVQKPANPLNPTDNIMWITSLVNLLDTGVEHIILELQGGIKYQKEELRKQLQKKDEGALKKSSQPKSSQKIGGDSILSKGGKSIFEKDIEDIVKD